MADVLRHHHTHVDEVPSRVYWAAAIGLVLLAVLFMYAATGSNPTAPATLTDMPFVPFVPIL